MKFLRLLNPEKNPHLRAILYTISASGVLHLIVISIAAPVNKNAQIVNPFAIVGIDELFPALGRGVWSAIIGWIIFVVTIYWFSKVIRRSPNK